MQIRRIFILTGTIIAAALALSILIDVPARESIIIHAPVNEVAAQFSKTKNWKNWYSRWSAIDSVNSSNPVAVTIWETRGKTRSGYFMTAMPADNGTSTRVDLEKTIACLSWLRNWSTNDTAVVLKELRSFVEDDNRRYGFPISIVPVTDTLILTTKRAITPDEKSQTINDLRESLQDFISKNHIALNGNYYFVSTSSASNGSIEVAVGMPVSEIKNEQKGFEFLKLPKNGRLLAGEFNAEYSVKGKLYEAMDKYVIDKRLKKVAQPLEKYSVGAAAFSDSHKVKMTIYYPIF